MNIEQFFQWAKENHYPQLVIGEKEVLRHGIEAYERLHRAGQIDKAIQRVEGWLNRMNKIAQEREA